MQKIQSVSIKISQYKEIKTQITNKGNYIVFQNKCLLSKEDFFNQKFGCQNKNRNTCKI